MKSTYSGRPSQFPQYNVLSLTDIEAINDPCSTTLIDLKNGVAVGIIANVGTANSSSDEPSSSMNVGVIVIVGVEVIVAEGVGVKASVGVVVIVGAEVGVISKAVNSSIEQAVRLTDMIRKLKEKNFSLVTKFTYSLIM